MKVPSHNQISVERRDAAAAGFSLVEIMVTVALLSVIILGLVAMFNQTRRAFTSSLTQVDVLESGRAVADLIARDLEQVAPCYYPNAPNFYVTTAENYNSLIHQLADPSDKWTNIIQDVFFLAPDTHNNQQWNGVGYLFDKVDVANSVGTLYRYNLNGFSITNQTTDLNLSKQNKILGNFRTATNINRIIDGVTHFQIRAYAPNGALIVGGNSSGSIGVLVGNFLGQDYQYLFTSNAVPAYVEVELGVMEARTLERYRSLVPGTPAARNYLAGHGAQVHLFRQRIPIRNADSSAFQ